MKRKYSVFLCLVIGFSYLTTPASAQLRTGGEPLKPVGPGVLIDALEPSLRKWYLPQELYRLYDWQQWEYTNYAKERYERYTTLELEGYRFYDLYGNFITRGWKIYEWTVDQPQGFGSSIFKNPKFEKWFSNLLVSSASKGQYFTALTIGDQIRTTLTPLTFCKPTFNGLQWDFLSDKYAATVLASRANSPGTARSFEASPAQVYTDYVNFIGFRGGVQVGRFLNLGATYVNSHIGTSLNDWAENSLKGRLSTGQNAGKVRTVTVRISDDSPEDGEGGGVLFSEQIFIDGRQADITPVVKGGSLRKGGQREASGNKDIFLVYDISDYTYVDKKGQPKDVSGFRKVGFVLVLANDYRVEVTSNLQTNQAGDEIFLPVTRAPGNVTDGTNQRLVKFNYGLPTGNEIYGVTLELDDVMGFSVYAEYDVNRRHRRFPNVALEVEEHSLATDKSEAWYITGSKLAYPWFAYGEVFNIDDNYTTSMFIPDESGNIFYDSERRYLFEFVDDNDDQDRFPDWERNPVNQRASNDKSRQDGIFPGLDTNNDRVPDFNQNQNMYPDYEEPFLRYDVDPPAYLFGMDQNNNTVIDRFENDNEPDYPYKRGHRGYNFYVGAEVVRGLKFTVGHLHEWLPASDKKSRSNYALLTFERDFASIGKVRLFDNLKVVHDNIPDDLYQWGQLPSTIGAMQAFDDPLVTRNTTINTAYADVHYVGIPYANWINKLKFETHHQRKSQLGLRDKSQFLGVISKFDYSLRFGDLALQPKTKGTFTRTIPFKQEELKRRDLSGIFSLIVSYPLLESVRIDSGVEYEEFSNLMEKPISSTGEYVEDFHGLSLAVQVSNVSSFLGYELTTKMAFRQQTWYFKDKTKTSAIAFVSVFAGME